MLNVNFFRPQKSISWLVRKFETIKMLNANGRLEDCFIPRPDIALVFHFADLPFLSSTTPKKQLKPIFIAPIRDKPLKISIQGNLDCFIAICNAPSISRLLQLDLSRLTEEDLVVNDPRFSNIFNNLSGITTCQERIECFSEHIEKLVPNGYVPDNIDYIYLEILQNNLNKTLSNIISGSTCSVSSLQRHFRIRTGVSMKRLIRIARINAIFEKMLEKNQFDYREILFESQYYDQSHFINDFKDITGDNPNSFFRQNSELCKILSGINYSGKPK